jgi:hypothetical protein
MFLVLPAFLHADRIGVDPGRFSAAYLRSTQTQWAWAAGLEQILRYYGVEIKQEEIARRMYGTNIDGTTRTNQATTIDQIITWCMKGWTADDRGKPFTARLIEWKGAPSAQVLQSELTAQHPMLALLDATAKDQYHAGGGEISVSVVIIDAADCTASMDGSVSVNSVEVRDPEITQQNPRNPGFVTLPFREFRDRIRKYWSIRVVK